MRYLMNQKIFSFSDSFSIYDTNGNDIYSVVGEVFSLGHKLSFRDINGNELFYIKQRLMKFAPTYEIYSGDTLCCTVSKKLFTFFNCKFEIDSNYGNIQVHGNFLDHDYSFTMNGREVATISKQWLSFRDKYTIDISDDIDNGFILATAVVIDLACHDNQNN